MSLDGMQEVPLARRSFSLTPVDLLLTMDFMLVALALGVVLNVKLGGVTRLPVYGAGLLVFAFAGWLGKRYKVPPPAPSSDPLRRVLGIVLLGFGGTLTLAGAAIAVMAVGGYIADKKQEIPFFVLPLSFLPLLLGHAIMYGGAKVRAPSA